MGTLDQLRHGVSQAMEGLSRGWHQLREHAGQALTRFHLRTDGGPVESVEQGIMRDAARWGVLACEVRETDESVVVSLEIPGMDSDDFHIDVVDDHLVVRGEKRLSREDAHGRYYVMERAYGSFERAMPLPAPVESQGATARYRKGVLTVTLPKNPRAMGRRIPVEGA